MDANKSKLNHLVLSGFKSIDVGSNSLDLNFSDINIIIGANGAGKSNVVSFFKMLNNMMTGALQQFVGKNGSAENLLHFGSKRTPLIKASLEFQNESNSDVYDFSLVRAVQDSLFFSDETVTWNGRKHELASGQKESYLLSGDATHSYEKIVRIILSNCRAFQFHDTSDMAHIRSAGDIDNNRFLMSDGGNLAAYLYMLKNKSPAYRKYYDSIVRKIRFVMPQFDDFVLEPQMLNGGYIKLRWKAQGEPEYTFGAEQLSDGTIRFMALATLFLQPPELLPTVIVIDEPELGLHPFAIDILADMIKGVADHAQVIVATQSARLVDNFLPSQIVVADYDAFQRCSLFRRLNEDELADWLQEFCLSELWEKNVIGGQP